MRFLVLGALAVLYGVLLFLALFQAGGTEVSAHVPHSGLDFSIGVDTNGNGSDDCTSSSSFACSGVDGRPIVISVYLNSTGLTGGYFLYRAQLDYTGVTSKARVIQTWPQCASATVVAYEPTVIFACAAASSTVSTYTGKMAEVVFTCEFPGGTVSLVHGTSGWQSVLFDITSHAEGEGTVDDLSVLCPYPTATMTPPTSCGPPAGDADGDGDRDAIDGMFVLQYVAGLRSSLRCPSNANVDGGAITATDGSLILQAVAGLISL